MTNINFDHCFSYEDYKSMAKDALKQGMNKEILFEALRENVLPNMAERMIKELEND